jgi:hypothetical protein
VPARTSRLLIAEPPLMVLPSLAALIGLNEAIFLQQLHYWLQKSGNERDGRLWVYNTYEEWLAQFPFWSKATLRRIVNGLEESGLVLSSSAYNQSKIDRTKWYSLDYDALDRLPESADHVLNVSTSTVQNEHMDVARMSTSNQETIQRQAQRALSKSSLTSPNVSGHDWQMIESYLEDFARELHDQAPIASTLTRTTKLYAGSGLSLDLFLATMQQARALTQKHSGGIRSEVPDGSGRKSKMAYFLATLEDLISRAA